jgi:hypothetical protein
MLAMQMKNLQQTASVAVIFWVSCLLLVVLEATVGANPVGAVLFFVSIPALVSGLLWANRSLLRAGERYTALATLLVSAFVYASVILLFWLLAASKLKSLLIQT